MAHTYRRRSFDEQGIVAVLFLILSVTFSYFFKNTNLVFFVFELVTLALFTIIALNSLYHIWHEDGESAFENIFIAIPLLFLFVLGYIYIENIPRELVNIVKEQNIITLFLDINSDLTNYGRNLSFDIFLASLCLLATLSYNAFNTYKKLKYGYIFETSYSTYILIAINMLLMTLSMFTFSIGIFR